MSLEEYASSQIQISRGAHGRDERMLVRSFYEGQTFLYEFVKALSH